MKEKLIKLKEELKRNRKCNTKNLYVCKLRFKDDYKVIRYIYKVSSSIFSKDILMFKNFSNGEIVSINIKDDKYIDIIEMVPFIEVFPYYFYPSLGVIENLNKELNDEKKMLLKK